MARFSGILGGVTIVAMFGLAVASVEGWLAREQASFAERVATERGRFALSEAQRLVDQFVQEKLRLTELAAARLQDRADLRSASEWLPGWLGSEARWHIEVGGEGQGNGSLATDFDGARIEGGRLNLATAFSESGRLTASFRLPTAALQGRTWPAGVWMRWSHEGELLWQTKDPVEVKDARYTQTQQTERGLQWELRSIGETSDLGPPMKSALTLLGSAVGAVWLVTMILGGRKQPSAQEKMEAKVEAVAARQGISTHPQRADPEAPQERAAGRLHSDPAKGPPEAEPVPAREPDPDSAPSSLEHSPSEEPSESALPARSQEEIPTDDLHELKDARLAAAAAQTPADPFQEPQAEPQAEWPEPTFAAASKKQDQTSASPAQPSMSSADLPPPSGPNGPSTLPSADLPAEGSAPPTGVPSPFAAWPPSQPGPQSQASADLASSAELRSLPHEETADLLAFDEAHYRKVYNDFVAAKARNGEAVGHLSYESFKKKLETSERGLMDKHDCKAVRFAVMVRGDKVTLRPQLVRSGK